MNDPKITMDTVRLANALSRGAWANGDGLLAVIRDAAAIERAGRRVHALNERHANDGAEESDKAADKAADRCAELCSPYGARFSRFGRGSGLWPFVEADGKDFSL